MFLDSLCLLGMGQKTHPLRVLLRRKALEMIHYKCPKCNSDMDAPDSQSGKAENCPGCGHPSVVPQQVQPVVVQPPLPRATTSPIVPQAQQQSVHIHQTIAPAGKKTSGLGIAALVLGILAAITCWMPFIGILGMPLAVIGCMLGGIGLLLALIGHKTSATMPISGLIICIVSIIITVLITGATVESLREGKNIEGMSGRKTHIITAIFEGVEGEGYDKTLSFIIMNNTNKTIEALKGGIHIYDQFGDHLDGLTIRLDAPLGPNETIIESGSWPTVKSRTIELMVNDGAKIKFKVEQVLYTDGTSEKF